MNPLAPSEYKMPAEWQPHSATQMHWPVNRETWPGKRLERVEDVFLDIIEILHQYEPIHLFVNDQESKEYVLKRFEARAINPEQIAIHLQQTNSVWARDCGPVFVQTTGRGERNVAITDWEFNAWGRKYPPFDADQKLPEYIAEMYGFQRFEPGMVLEGGSVEPNGDGVILTTESVLLNKNRNPGLSKTDIEHRLQNYLGAGKTIWLKKGLAGDDTDGHIDELARFLNSNTILAIVSEDSDNVNYQTLQENLQILQKATDLRGNPFSIETLPLPAAKIRGRAWDGSTHFPASYANFYIANRVVLVPLYDERYDEQALSLFERYFPERDMHGISCVDLVWGQGSIHCVTQPWFGFNDKR